MGSKQTEKPQEPDVITSKMITNRYRYFCDACTGIAFLSADKKNPGVSACQNCGKFIHTIKEENFINL